MKPFRNLRLATRLGAVFGAVAAGLLILAVVGVSSLKSEYATAERLGHKDMPAVKALGSIQFAMVAYRADQLAHAHQTDDAGRADQESQMAEHDAIMQKAFKEYEGLYVNDQDRRLAASASATGRPTSRPAARSCRSAAPATAPRATPCSRPRSARWSR